MIRELKLATDRYSDLDEKPRRGLEVVPVRRILEHGWPPYYFMRVVGYRYFWDGVRVYITGRVYPTGKIDFPEDGRMLKLMWFLWGKN